VRDTPVPEQFPGPEIEGAAVPELLVVKVSSGLELREDRLNFRRGAVTGEFTCQLGFGVIPNAQQAEGSIE
jgi:hypothetical protein